MGEEYADDFETIVGEVADIGQFQTFSGVSCTYLHALADNVTWMNTLSIFPRVHDVENRAMSGEPLHPGSFSSVIMGTASGMPYRVSFTQGLWLPEVSLTVPMGPSSIEMTASITDTFAPILKADLAQRMRQCTLTATLVAQNLSQGTAEVAAAFKLGAMKLGGYLSYRTLDGETMGRFVWNFLSRLGYGLGLYTVTSSDGVSAVASVQKKIGRTRVGCALHVVPKVLGGECYVGLEREFSMSTLSAAISTSGTVKSCFVRHLDKSMRVTFTGQSNVLSATHSFGIAITMQ